MSPEQAQSRLELLTTSDGSATLLHTGFNQTYHSINGALQEARHVFLQQGLLYFLEQGGASAARVSEVGFGAGLNFLVSAAHCLQNEISLVYTGIEPFPVDPEILRKSNYSDVLPGTENREAFLAWYPGEQPLCLPALQAKPGKVTAQDQAGEQTKRSQPAAIRLELIRQAVLETGPLPPADIIYFDAFAPATQPEMWTAGVISHVVAGLETGGVFVSYSITGNLKRTLRGLGFRIEKPMGAAGKREMIRAVKI